MKSKICKLCLTCANILVLIILMNIFLFKTKLRNTEVRNYMLKQLEPFKEGVGFEKLEKVYNLTKKFKMDYQLCFIQVISQQVYSECHAEINFYSEILHSAIYKVLEFKHIPNVEFILACDDVITKEFPFKDVPVFAFSKRTKDKNAILLPDPYLLQISKWEYVIRSINGLRNSTPWEKKEARIFFRGASSDIQVKANHTASYVAENSARYKLVEMSKKHPDKIIATFNNYQFVEKEAIEIIRKEFGSESAWASFPEHLKYRYLMSLDGKGCAWMRVPWIMYSDSVLFKHETDLRQWFYGALKPYKHYIPVEKKDLSDLEEKIDWAESNQDQVRKISSLANQFVRENLTPEKVLEDLALILTSYSYLQNFYPKKRFPHVSRH